MAIDRTKVNPADDTPVNDIELTEQEIFNKSFDKSFNILGTVAMGYTGTRLRRVKVTDEGKLDISGEITTTPDPYKIVAGPLEDTGYLYIGYKDGDRWYIKRQNTTTKMWGYAYGLTDFDGNWAVKSELTYGDPA